MADNPDAAGETQRLQRWAWYSVLVNIVLAALHGLIAAASGSLAVAAETVHNLTDLLAALAVLAGLRLAGRKSHRFPYGLYKVENVVALGLAGLVLVSAYEILRDAVLAPPATVVAEPWMLAALAVTLILPLVFSHFEMQIGRAAHSPSLMADAREYRVHALTTGLAGLALASQWLGLPLDRVAAGLIVLAVLKMGWDILRDAMRVLLDASLEAETLKRIREVIQADPIVSELKWVTGRNAGRYRFVEAGVALRGETQGKAETAIPRIETAVRKAVPRIERVLVRAEARSTPWLRYAVPLADSRGEVSTHFGAAPYFTLLTVARSDGHLQEQRIVANPFQQVERGKGIRVAEWLIGHNADVVFSREDLGGRGPTYVFGDAGIELRMTDAVDLDGVLAQIKPSSDAPAAISPLMTISTASSGVRP